MNCRYCNAPLDKDDAVCPKCGKIVIDNGPMLGENKEIININNSNNTNDNDNNINNNNNNINKVNKNIYKISIIPILLIVAAIMGVFYLKNTYNDNRFLGSKNVDFAGYKIKILRGYNYDINKYKKELTISNDEYNYTVMVDFDYSYNDYVDHYTKETPTFAKQCKTTIDGKDYFAMVTNKGDMNYYTKADLNSTFIGKVKNKEQMYSFKDLEDLNKMLKNVVVKKKDKTYDIGGDEMVLSSQID